MEGIKQLAKHLNILRINTFYHVKELKRVTPEMFRVLICRKELVWMSEQDEYEQILLAKSIAALFAMVSKKHHFNWHNFDLLEEIIANYGDSTLKSELESFKKAIEAFEKQTPLNDVKNIIFTPLGSNCDLLKVPIPQHIETPTMHVARRIKIGLMKENDCAYPIHHVEQNVIFFIIPRMNIMHTVKKVKMDPRVIENRIAETLCEEHVLKLLEV